MNTNPAEKFMAGHMWNIFYRFFRNMLDAITRDYGLYFIAAILGTWILIITGVDWAYNRLAYNNGILVRLGIPSMFSGAVLPILVPLLMYILGFYRRDRRLEAAALAMAQGAILILLYNTILKGISGRADPGLLSMFWHERSTEILDYSREFAWNSWGRGEGDFVIGWPSGHTSDGIIAAVIIHKMFPEKKWPRAVSFAYALYLAWGISVSVHWLSEVFAGALIGYSVGETVGESYLSLYHGEKKKSGAISQERKEPVP